MFLAQAKKLKFLKNLRLALLINTSISSINEYSIDRGFDSELIFFAHNDISGPVFQYFKQEKLIEQNRVNKLSE